MTWTSIQIKSKMCKVLQWNTQSLMANKPDLSHFLSKQQHLSNLICVQETYLKNNHSFQLAGYNVEHADHHQSQGGGVATLIKQGLQYTRMAKPTSMESVIIKLKMELSDIIIINVYDSPDNQVDETSYRQLFFRAFIVMPSY